MYELHENEQYFFDEPTLERLASFVSTFATPCCVCAPLLGKHIVDRGGSVRILDIDTRFAGVPGFRRFDLRRPEWLGEKYDLIVCDPPFFKVSLSRLFAGIRVLSCNDFGQSILVSYLVRRSHAVLGTFARFGLRPSGARPTYQTVQRTEWNEVEFFTNLDAARLEGLRGPA